MSKSRKVGKNQYIRPFRPSFSGWKVEKSKNFNKIDHLDSPPHPKVEKSKKFNKIDQLDPRIPGRKVEKLENFNNIDHLDPSPKVENSENVITKM